MIHTLHEDQLPVGSLGMFGSERVWLSFLMATFLSRTASYAALQRPKSNPELRTKEPFTVPTYLNIVDKETSV